MASRLSLHIGAPFYVLTDQIKISKSNKLSNFLEKRSYSYEKLKLFLLSAQNKGWWHLIEAIIDPAHEYMVCFTHV